MISSPVYSQQSNGTYQSKIQIDGETIRLVSRLSQTETDQLKLKESIQKLRSTFLEFLNTGEKKYLYPQKSETNLIILKNEDEWKNYVATYFFNSPLMKSRHGFYDYWTNTLFAFPVKIEDDRDRPIELIILHEYTHYLCTHIFNSNVDPENKSRTSTFRYEWLYEGLANYLSSMVLYGTGVSKHDIADMNFNYQTTGAHLLPFDIMKAQQSGDLRFYIYSAMLLSYWIDKKEQNEIVKILAAVFSKDVDYSKIIIDLYARYSYTTDIETDFELYLGEKLNSSN